MKRAIEDSDVLAAVKDWGNRTMTYVVRNRLASKGRPNLKTAHVRRQLERMERAGKVKRVPSRYATQICWSATTEGVDT